MNTAGIGLNEPQQIDWDNYNPGSKYSVPPPAKGPDGKALVYTGQLPTTVVNEADDNNFRRYLFDPIKLVKNGGSADGYVIRFTRASIKPFERDGKPQNASAAGNVLRSAGAVGKPQKTAEYDAAMQQVKGRVVSFTIDWEARNKDTGEKVSGYDNFPLDPDRPGQRKAILKQGDTYTVSDRQGNILETKTVQSEVLFANARVKYFVDPSRK